jgi:DNA-binding CsgD family transcriptional regulator
MAEAGEPLSDRELIVLERLVDGSTNREIASNLSISHNTVKVHLRNIFTKLGVSSRTEAITVAIQKGLLTVPGTVDVGDSTSTKAHSSAVPQAESQDVNQVSDAASTSPPLSPNWRIIAIVLLLLVALLFGVLIGPQLSERDDGQVDEITDGTDENSLEQPIDDSDWLIAQPMPGERANMALVAVGLDLYQIGGEVGAGVVNLVDVYDTSTGRWSSASAKPTAVSDASAGVLFGEIYVPGGRLADGTPTSVVEAYSPANNAWRPVTPLPKPIAAGLTLVDDGLLYVVGGWDGEEYLGEGQVYDPDTEEWRNMPPMAQARSAAAGGVLSGGLYIVGGHDGIEELDRCEYFDPDEQAWFDCQPMLLSRSKAGAAVLGNNRLFVIGGGVEGEVPSGEVYNAANDSWQQFEMPMIGDALSWHSLGATNVETRIFAIGGRQGEMILADNYIYAPFIHQTFLPTVGGDN